jgi:peptidoglycan glycosyltransferase
MTPIHLALATSAVANDGVMPKPYIVSKVTDGNTIISRTSASEIAQPISSEIAEQLKELMLETVNSGTGTAARLSGIKVCGKTGTAENEMTTYDENKTHALFVGFAQYDDPEIAVSVILENAGYGGSVAAPIAREVMKTYFSGK